MNGIYDAYLHVCSRNTDMKREIISYREQVEALEAENRELKETVDLMSRSYAMRLTELETEKESLEDSLQAARELLRNALRRRGREYADRDGTVTRRKPISPGR